MPGLPVNNNQGNNQGLGSPISLGQGGTKDNPTIGDQLSQLYPMSLASANGGTVVSFPGMMFKESSSNSLAIHRYPNLPGARVENMGKNESYYDIKVIFSDHIFPSPLEGWYSGQLFQTAYYNLINLLQDPGNKRLIHPIYGQIAVQVERWTTDIDPNLRDGVTVNMVCVETIADNVTIVQTLQPAPGSGLSASAASTDAAIAAVPNAAPPSISLNNFFSGVASTLQQFANYPNTVISAATNAILNPLINGISTVSSSIIAGPGYALNNSLALLQQEQQTVLNAVASQINALNYDFNAYQSAAVGPFPSSLPSSLPSLASPASASPASSVSKSPIDQSSIVATSSLLGLNNTSSPNYLIYSQKVQRAIIDLRTHYVNQQNPMVSSIISNLTGLLGQVQQLQASTSSNTNTQNVKVTSFVPKLPVTWLSLVSFLNQSVDDLLSLNPQLSQSNFIPAGSTVFFYQD